MKDGASRRRARRLAIGAAVVLALAGMNGPWLYRFGTEQYHEYKINKPEYKAENGHWDVVDFPEEYRQNTIHAALLHTGKILLIAGSRQRPGQLRREEVRHPDLGPGQGHHQEDPDADRPVLHGPHPARQRQSADRGRHQALREARRVTSPRPAA